MIGEICVALCLQEDTMGSILGFMSRNLRIAIAIAVVAAAVGGAGAIGWITAPL
jgi:flagellar basal body-associated protein FliL